jgi:hypothetical protein
MEGLGYIRVELNIEPLLDCEFGVALLASLADPILELISNFCKDNVTNVRPAHLPDLPKDRQRVDNFLMGEGELENEVQLQAIILGHIDDLDLGAWDGPKDKLD